MKSGNVGKEGRSRTRRVCASIAIAGMMSLASCAHPSAGTTASRSEVVDIGSFVNTGDSAGIARAIQRACRTAQSRTSCYEAPLAATASAGQVKLAMGALGQLGAIDEDIKRNGHVYAHAIGIAAGKRGGDIAETFTQCSESFQSGCYHGVIQARFAALDSVGVVEANAMCQPFRQNESQRWIRFQCVHGMGHGLTTLNDHDLPKGLAGCDLLSDSWDKQSCYGGAFMENIINVTHPHHPASTLAHNDAKGGTKRASDEHEGMAGMEHEHSRRFKAVDPTDPLYPCSVLADRYQSACYQMQTSVILYNNKGDIAATAHACDGAPEKMRVTCYASLGRDVSSFSLQNHAVAIRMCSMGTARYQPWCYFGLVKNIVDLNARPADGIALCRDVPNQSGKLLCYVAVGEQVGLLATDAEQRRSMCLPSEAAFLDACLFGARVKMEQPAGLAQVWEAARAR